MELSNFYLTEGRFQMQAPQFFVTGIGPPLNGRPDQSKPPFGILLKSDTMIHGRLTPLPRLRDRLSQIIFSRPFRLVRFPMPDTSTVSKISYPLTTSFSDTRHVYFPPCFRLR
jgi:hypothetical protein